MPITPIPIPSSLPLIGWKEWVSLPELGIPAIKAKIDTGARTSALHAYTFEGFRRDATDMVRFSVHPLQRRCDIERHCEAEVLEHRSVKNSGGQVEERYVIRTLVEVGDLSWPIEITLTNRTGMRFRMLLGRTTVRDRLLIDPGKAYLCGRRRAKAYGAAKTISKRKKRS